MILANVVRPVFKVKCDECQSTISEVRKHIHIGHWQHSVELENTETQMTESKWFERGINQSTYITALNLRDGGSYNLPPV